MNKSLLAFLLLSIPLISYGQARKPLPKLPAVTNEITRQALLNNMAILTRQVSITLDQVKENFAKVSILPKSSSLLKKNKIAINEYLNSINRFGESQKGLYLDDPSNLPFGFYSFNGQTAFLQSGLMGSNALNTLKLDADERASMIAKEVLLPGLSNFEPLLANADINYFCLTTGYVARDFSEDENSVAYKDGETVAIVISKATLRKYLNAEITDQDVFKLASFYNSNKSSGLNIRKVMLK